MNFIVDFKQMEKFREWKSHHEDVYSGATGGRYSWIFTPTSIGLCTEVQDNITKVKINLTDYSDW